MFSSVLLTSVILPSIPLTFVNCLVKESGLYSLGASLTLPTPICWLTAVTISGATNCFPSGIVIFCPFIVTVTSSLKIKGLTADKLIVSTLPKTAGLIFVCSAITLSRIGIPLPFLYVTPLIVKSSRTSTFFVASVSV